MNIHIGILTIATVQYKQRTSNKREILQLQIHEI